MTSRRPQPSDDNRAPDLDQDSAYGGMFEDFALHAISDLMDNSITPTHPFVRELAAGMEDAAWDWGETWLARYSPFITRAPIGPHECWCGLWPALGTACPTHGSCTCRYASTGIGRFQVRGGSVRRGFDGDPPQIMLPGDCIVHPDAVVPVEHVRRLYDAYQNQTWASSGEQRPPR